MPGTPTGTWGRSRSRRASSRDCRTSREWAAPRCGRYRRAVPEPMIDLLDGVWSSIAALCRDLDEAQWNRATDCPGWSVKDNVAHMIGTERMLLGEHPDDVDVSNAAHVRNDIGKVNEQWIAPMREKPGAEVLATFESVTERRLAALRALDDAAWDAEGFTPEGP